MSVRIIESWIIFRRKFSSCKHPIFDHFLGPSLHLVGKIKQFISHLLASCASHDVIFGMTDTMNVLCCFILNYIIFTLIVVFPCFLEDTRDFRSCRRDGCGNCKVWQWFMISAMMHVDAYEHKRFI